MIVAIPVLNKRVAPRCIYADIIYLTEFKYGKIVNQKTARLNENTSVDLVRILSEQRVDKFICSGISKSTRESIAAHDIAVIENVTGTIEEILEALPSNKIKSGFGLLRIEESGFKSDDKTGNRGTVQSEDKEYEDVSQIDCLSCKDRICIKGNDCMKGQTLFSHEVPDNVGEMLEVAMDVAFEEERKLCRLAELVYYCLGMRYEKIGVAFCIDLLHPATVLTTVLRRFFSVFPVCCKIGGVVLEDVPFTDTSKQHENRTNHVACNPVAQAEILNRIGTDLNVLVGLCVGADCVFTKTSKAPVSTIFVKDKSLANNPIGAIYSDYYLNEI